MELVMIDILLLVLIYEERWSWARRGCAQIKEVYIYVRVLEAVAASRAAEELLGEADVAAHGADRGGCGGGGAGHGDS
jgi:hypothetical protein